jgi:autotransporter-associated beta strand protein
MIHVHFQKRPLPAVLTVNGGNFGGLISDGQHSGYSGGGITKEGAGTLTLSGDNGYTGATSVTGGTLVVNGTIASSSGVVVSHGAELSGHGSVSKISGAGLVAPGDPQILTATQVDPSGGLSFAFSFTQPGLPTFGNASASGNDVLHITGSTPFVFSLTSANIVTLDFSGATLLANQTYLGGFFTDTDIANSVVNSADFIYTGLNGAVVQYEGLVQEPSAAFAGGTVTNGEVMEFKVTSPAPEPSTVTMLLGGAGAFVNFKRRRRGNGHAYSRAALPPTRLRA